MLTGATICASHRTLANNNTLSNTLPESEGGEEEDKIVIGQPKIILEDRNGIFIKYHFFISTFQYLYCCFTRQRFNMADPGYGVCRKYYFTGQCDWERNNGTPCKYKHESPADVENNTLNALRNEKRNRDDSWGTLLNTTTPTNNPDDDSWGTPPTPPPTTTMTTTTHTVDVPPTPPPSVAPAIIATTPATNDSTPTSEEGSIIINDEVNMVHSCALWTISNGCPAPSS